MAKRLLPFTSIQSKQPSSPSKPTQPQHVTKLVQSSETIQSTINLKPINLVQTSQTVKPSHPKPKQFQLKVPSARATVKDSVDNKNVLPEEKLNTEAANIKLIIEKKRQEALMRLRKRQPQSKIT